MSEEERMEALKVQNRTLLRERNWLWTNHLSETRSVQKKRQRKFENDVNKRAVELEFNAEMKKLQAEGVAFSIKAMFEDCRRVDAIVAGRAARKEQRKKWMEVELEDLRRTAAVQEKLAMRRHLKKREKAKKEAEQEAKREVKQERIKKEPADGRVASTDSDDEEGTVSTEEIYEETGDEAAERQEPESEVAERKPPALQRP